METLSNCLCCGQTDFKLFLRAKDNYAGEEFDIVQCTSCGFIFTNPRPELNVIAKYYTSPDYMSHNSHGTGLLPGIYRAARNYMMHQKLKLIRKSIGKEKDFALLDFGCGTGDFLGFIQQNGILAEGVEPDEQARAIAKSVNHVDTYSMELSAAIPPEKYDVITLWHVLEHIHELHAQIDFFSKWLKKDGKLIIAVPNIESYDAKKYGKYWDALDVPRHIYHYSPENIKQIFGQHRFRFVEQHPLVLDAYYVSMRSEWHRGTGKLFSYAKAILTGFTSNHKASKTGNYSSLIYVFSKK